MMDNGIIRTDPIRDDEEWLQNDFAANYRCSSINNTDVCILLYSINNYKIAKGQKSALVSTFEFIIKR